MERDADLCSAARRSGPRAGLPGRLRPTSGLCAAPAPRGSPICAARSACRGLRAAGSSAALLAGALLTAALLWAAPGLSSGPAAAQSAISAQGETCGSRAEVVSRLKAKYGETRRGYGLQRGRSVVEVYASTETGSWTIIMSMPDGLACLVAAGQNWAASGAETSEPVGDPA